MNKRTDYITIFVFLSLFVFQSSHAQDKPEPPLGVKASSQAGVSAIKVEWSSSATEGAAFYKIYRSDKESSVGSRINIVPAQGSSFSYIDTSVSYKKTYYYRISAVKDDVESDYSNPVSATALMPVPINVRAQDAQSENAVKVTWDRPDPGLVLWFDVYRSEKESSLGKRIVKKTSATEYIDRSVNHNSRYYYRIRSVDADNNVSADSESASAVAIAEFDTFKPTNVKTRLLSNRGVQLSWSAPKYVDVSSYLVYRSSSESDLGSLRAEVSGRSFSEYALDDGAVYYYKVKAVAKDGAVSDSSESARVAIKSDGQQAFLEPVSGLSTVPTGKSGQIKLTWKNPASGNFSYVRVYRGLESGAGNAQIADKVKGTSFTDNGLVNGVTYYYIVKSVSKDGAEGAQSTEESASPYIKSKNEKSPSPVSSLHALDVGDGKSLKLTWQNPGSGEYSYIKIYRSEAEGVIGKTIVNRLKGASYLDSSGITVGQRYYYTVKTVNIQGLESENNITVRGISTTALDGEVSSHDADTDGLPDVWERKYGFNAHLKDLIDEDNDKDGLGAFQEYENGTDPWNPDSDNDGYSDGTEVLNNYNPLGAGRAPQVGEISKKAVIGEFAYAKARLSSIKEEDVLARELKSLLEYEFGKGKIPNPKSHWPKLVNAYIYGRYTAQEIAHTLRYGPGLVHPSIEASLWRESDEYKKKQ